MVPADIIELTIEISDAQHLKSVANYSKEELTSDRRFRVVLWMFTGLCRC
jgi:hypothetical protein